MVKSFVRQGLTYAHAAYANLTKRVKNKTLKRILNWDIAQYTQTDQLVRQIGV